MSKKEIDFEKEIEKLARQSNINIRKSEYAFENQIKKLDEDIDNLAKNKIKEFNKNKQLTSDYLNIDYRDGTIERYREKLKRFNFSSF